MKKTDKQKKGILSVIMCITMSCVMTFSFCVQTYGGDETGSGNTAVLENTVPAQDDNTDVSTGNKQENSEEPLNENNEDEGESGENPETPENPDTPDTPEPCTHVWGKWEIVKSAGYFHTGRKVRKCENCSETESAVIKKKVAYNKWITENGYKYYLNGKGKKTTRWTFLYTNNSKTGHKHWCYFNTSGHFIRKVSTGTRSEWVRISGKKYYFSRNGNPLGKGFHFIGDNLYYMNSRRAVVTGSFKTGGHKYTANSRGEVSIFTYYKHKYRNFILVDISEQKLYLYRNKNRVMKTSVVTGKRGIYDTPTGIYSMGNKRRGAWLAGPTWGVRVSYWMPFIGGYYGFHDASWRSASDFNSSYTYVRNGSHGCVNMRTYAAATLYNNTYRGMKVIIR